MKGYLLPAALVGVAAVALILLLFGTTGPSVPLREPATGKSVDPTPVRPSPMGESAIMDSSGSSTTPKAANGLSIVPSGGGPAQTTAETVIDVIDDAAYSSSPDALPLIAQQLNNPDPEVREAAVDGIKILSDPAAIPILRKAASRARNEQERQRLLDAAEWLALPDWVPPNR